VNIFMVLIKLKLLCNYLLAKMLQYHISFKWYISKPSF
jgi:hypothetical protein